MQHELFLKTSREFFPFVFSGRSLAWILQWLKTVPSEMWKAQSVPFHISEGTDSVIYLLRIRIVFHILSVFVFIYTGKRKEKSPLAFT